MQNRTVVEIIEVEVVPCIPMDRILERVVEQIVDTREPHVMVKVVKIQNVTQQVQNTLYQLQTVSSQDPASESLRQVVNAWVRPIVGTVEMKHPQNQQGNDAEKEFNRQSERSSK